jgi:hypothetical protein
MSSPKPDFLAIYRTGPSIPAGRRKHQAARKHHVLQGEMMPHLLWAEEKSCPFVRHNSAARMNGRICRFSAGVQPPGISIGLNGQG